MKRYVALILLVAGLILVWIFLNGKFKRDRATERVEALNQLRSELIRRKVLRSAQTQQTFSVSNIDAIAERLDTLPVREPEFLPDTSSDKLLMERYNYELFAIYGYDNRVDISCRGVRNRNDFLTLNDGYIVGARTVCALIPRKLLEPRGNVYKLTAGTLSETKFILVKPCSASDELCFNNQVYNESIKYANQRVGADCSGFGYKEDLIVTANHCFNNGKEYTDFYYVFGYVFYPEHEHDYQFIPKEDVYEGVAVVGGSTADDYRIIKVDRRLRSWQRATLNKNAIAYGDSIYMAGHPDGLPLKLTLNATVFSFNNTTFSSDLDAFHGNSGAPVFNKSGEVIGILLRGDYDYEQIDGGCMKYYKPPTNYGETVLRANRIP